MLQPPKGSRKYVMVLIGVLLITAVGLIEAFFSVNVDAAVFEHIAWITGAGVAGNGIEHAARAVGNRTGSALQAKAAESAEDKEPDFS